MNVTIQPTGRRVFFSLESSHRTDDQETAIQRAVRKHWGRAVFFKDDGRGSDTRRFGQVWRPTNYGNTAETGVVMVDVA